MDKYSYKPHSLKADLVSDRFPKHAVCQDHQKQLKNAGLLKDIWQKKHTNNLNSRVTSSSTQTWATEGSLLLWSFWFIVNCSKRQLYCSPVFLTNEIPLSVCLFKLFLAKYFQLLNAMVVHLEQMYTFLDIQCSVKLVEVCIYSIRCSVTRLMCPGVGPLCKQGSEVKCNHHLHTWDNPGADESDHWFRDVLELRWLISFLQ